MLTQRVLWIAVGVFVVLSAMKTTAIAQTDVEEKNRRIVQTSFDNWRRGAGSPFDLQASDAKWTIVGRSVASGIYQGRRDFMDQVVIPFMAIWSSSCGMELQWRAMASRMKTLIRGI